MMLICLWNFELNWMIFFVFGYGIFLLMEIEFGFWMYKFIV